MKIAVINTGGTISCIGNPLAPMTAESFASASETLLNPILKQAFPDIEVSYLCDITFPESKSKTLDSTNLQPTDWCIMANGVLENYQDFDGFLILHGTDSMDFTGGALPFLLNAFDDKGFGTAVLSKPVIITGSQVPLYYQDNAQAPLTLNFNTDAFQNMCGAVASARTGVPEVCVYFQNHLYRGNRAIKVNASELDAFATPNYPALAESGVELSLFSEHWLPGPVHNSVSLDNAEVLKSQQSSLSIITEKLDQFPIAQLNAFPAHYSQVAGTAFMADMITAMVSAGAKGLILESYGEGNFPSGNPDSPSDGAIYQALNNANTQGINIIDCTQVISGTVNNSAYASGAWLPQVGALNPADMTPMTALAKLMILSSLSDIHQWSRATLQTLCQSNLIGEMTSVNNLDSRTNSTLMPGQSISSLDGSVSLINDQALGPRLMVTSDEQVLWQLPNPPQSDDLPGRWVMQNDGNLVFYSRFNQALWASNTGLPSGASSKLMLNGSYKSAIENSVSLQVYNYSDNVCRAVLYQAE